MTTHTDTEALDKLEALADELDHIGAGTPECAAPEVIGESATAIRSLIAELRQERERADITWEDAEAVARSDYRLQLSIAVNRYAKAESALSRAEGAIEKALEAIRDRDGDPDGRIERLLRAENILTDYDKQKEGDQ